MSLWKNMLIGICVALMASAIGIPAFSAMWWLFIIAGNILATVVAS